jgi:hypothetical protein
VYVVFNTFFALLSQEDQVRCFSNVARRLRRAGKFVIEVFVPDLGRFEQDQTFRTSQVGTDHVILEASRHDPVGQRIYAQSISLSENETSFYPVRLRYAWPSELDLMARLAGLRLRERWGGWLREPFAASSAKHVSVYERER